MPFGAEIREDGFVRFRVFAPAVSALELALDGAAGRLPMQSGGDGWHELDVREAGAGTRYRYVLPDGTEVPDPASRFQPEDVSGPSEVIDPGAYAWADNGWCGRPWSEAVLYELHVGTFTEEGTFRGAIARLDHLQELGITAIELMCIADFAGNCNWGYDGVLFYAPDSAYGRSDDLKAFIDAAHARGLMIILDVVYNHFGPEGNYMPMYFPQICTDRYCTPWGQALNFDGAYSHEVRDFIVHNALYWIEEFHVDGLRLDAAHAMIDTGPTHILDELADRVHELVGERSVHLVLENDTYVPERLTRDAQGEAHCYTAQWNHDMTHLLGASMAASCDEPPSGDNAETERLGIALARGYVIAAEMKGGQSLDVSPTSFVAFLQTHDLIGNRIFGDRLFSIGAPGAIRSAFSILLLLPQIPMMFMGDEFGASTPFPYFCDFHGELADAVRKGRCEQLAKQQETPDPEALKRAPDPEAESTFRSGKLRWEELGEEIHAEWLAWFKHVLRVRHESVVPLLRGLNGACGEYKVLGPSALAVNWTLKGGARLSLAANLCGRASSGFGEPQGKLLWAEGPEPSDGRLGPWSVRWYVDPA